MRAPRAMLDKSRPTIRDMFASIAPRYDLLNLILSLGLDRSWRREAAGALALEPASRVLDLATGTGDLLLELERSRYHSIGADFCVEMMALGRRKLRVGPGRSGWVAADGLELPFRDGSFDGLTVGFGIRNFEDLGQGLAEMARVLRPGGRVGVLEFPAPPGGLAGLLYRTHLRCIIPSVGRLVSPCGPAYSYLGESVRRHLEPERLATLLGDAGFRDVAWRRMSFGVVVLHTGTKR